MNVRSPMKHPSLRRLTPRERRHSLQRFNSSWSAAVGLFLFMLVTAGSLLMMGMILVETGVTARLSGPDGDAVAILAAVIPSVALGALAWEALRRAVINGSWTAVKRASVGMTARGSAGGPGVRSAGMPCGRIAPPLAAAYAWLHGDHDDDDGFR